MSKDYKALYEALIEDVRKHCLADNCTICVGSTDPCAADCDLECAACTKKCRCSECLDGNKFEWRGESDE